MIQLRNAVICMAVALAVTGCDSQQKQTPETTMEETQLSPFDLQKEFADNGFTFFTKNLILCSGDTNESNAMTIGWGGIGNYLGHDRPSVTVYVAPGRYTWQFMERHPRFTIMEFDDPEIWKFLGRASGRDYNTETLEGDARKDPKAAQMGLTLAYTENGTPYYKEAKLVIECETMTAWHQTADDFRNATAREWYKEFAPGIHTVYIGEVTGAWKK